MVFSLVVWCRLLVVVWFCIEKCRLLLCWLLFLMLVLLLSSWVVMLLSCRFLWLKLMWLCVLDSGGSLGCSFRFMLLS